MFLFVGYIYEIVNKINNKKYIGQTYRENINIRWDQHIYGLNKQNHGNIYLQRAWNKYKEYNFQFNIIEHIKNDDKLQLINELNYLEEYYIKLFKTTNHKFGYNIRPGGANSPMAEETIEKIKQSMIGKTHTDITKEKMSKSASGENNFWFGKNQPESSKQKISQTLKGRPSPTKSKVMSVEQKQKISKTLLKNGAPFKGKHHTEETKLIIKEKAIGRKHSSEAKEKIGKASKEIILNKRWENKDLILELYLKIMQGNNPKVLAIEYNQCYNTTILPIKYRRGECGKIINYELQNNEEYRKQIENTIIYKLMQINVKYLDQYFINKVSFEETINIYNDIQNGFNFKQIGYKFNCDPRKVKTISQLNGIHGDIIKIYKGEI